MSAGTPSRVVARDEEIARLDERLAEALAGRGQVCFVVGDPGAGKTTLVGEFARRAQDRDAELVVAVADCNARTGSGDPYLPFREILGLLTGDVDADLGQGNVTEENAGRLRRFLRISGQALVDSGPDLIGIFIPGGSLLAHLATRLSSGSPLTQRVQALLADRAETQRAGPPSPTLILEQYTNVLRAAASQQPLVLVIDDLQWADPASLDLLFHLGRRIEGSRILLIGTFRPNDLAIGRAGERHPLEAVVAELKRYYGDVMIDLDGTSGERRRELVEAMVEVEPNALGPGFRDALFAHTEGHALFTAELLRHLRESGSLVRDADGRWVEGAELRWDVLPTRVEGVIEERIGRLDGDAQALLGVAAVEGEEFTAEVAARVCGEDERATIRRLSTELDRQHRLVLAQGVRRAQGVRLSSYRFHHSLFQRFLYQRLDPVERSLLHEEVGSALETLFASDPDEVVVHLAHHFQEAGDVDRAARYFHLAGERALRLSANHEAIAHFRTGLGLIEQLNPGPERDARELAVQSALAAPLVATRGFAAPEVGAVYDRVAELSGRMKLAEQPFPILLGVVTYQLTRGRTMQALHLSERMLEVAHAAGDNDLLPTAYVTLAYLLIYTGRLEEAQQRLEEGLAIHDATARGRTPFVAVFDPAVGAKRGLALVAWLRGAPEEEALDWLDRAVRDAESFSAYNLAAALGFGVALHYLRQDVAATRETALTLHALATDKGFPFWRVWSSIGLGWCDARSGGEPERVAEALGRMREGIAAWTAMGCELWRPLILALYGEALLAAGQPEEAIAALSEGVAMGGASGERCWEAELLRLRASARRRLGEEAADDLAAAAAVAAGQGAHRLEARALADCEGGQAGPDAVR